MTNAAQINSAHQLCHGPEGGARGQPLVGVGGETSGGKPAFLTAS
jgi:hypothetical protein